MELPRLAAGHKRGCCSSLGLAPTHSEGVRSCSQEAHRHVHALHYIRGQLHRKHSPCTDSSSIKGLIFSFLWLTMMKGWIPLWQVLDASLLHCLVSQLPHPHRHKRSGLWQLLWFITFPVASPQPLCSLQHLARLKATPFYGSHSSYPICWLLWLSAVRDRAQTCTKAMCMGSDLCLLAPCAPGSLCVTCGPAPVPGLTSIHTWTHRVRIPLTQESSYKCSLIRSEDKQQWQAQGMAGLLYWATPADVHLGPSYPISPVFACASSFPEYFHPTLFLPLVLPLNILY